MPKRGKLGGLSFELVKFTSACMVMALKHLFEHDILHRDIKVTFLFFPPQEN